MSLRAACRKLTPGSACRVTMAYAPFDGDALARRSVIRAIRVGHKLARVDDARGGDGAERGQSGARAVRVAQVRGPRVRRDGVLPDPGGTETVAPGHSAPLNGKRFGPFTVPTGVVPQPAACGPVLSEWHATKTRVAAIMVIDARQAVLRGGARMGGTAEGGKIQPHALRKNAPQPVKRQTAGPRDLAPAACVMRHRQSLQSGRRDSNPRHQAWKASALPTELLPHLPTTCRTNSGGGRIRTFEGLRRQIYSLFSLAT